MKNIKKSMFVKIGLISLLSSSLFAVYDPIVKGTTWKQSEKNNVMNHCMATAMNSPEWHKAFPSRVTKTNVCICITDEMMQRSDYRDFLIMARIKFREIGIEQGKYKKSAIQTNEDRLVEQKIKRLDKLIMRKCATPEVANKGVLEAYKKFKKEADAHMGK